MTRKEKAEEIFNKMLDEIKTSDLNVCHTGDLEEEERLTAKLCALVAVEEIINTIKIMRVPKELKSDSLNSLQQVKQEIEKL